MKIDLTPDQAQTAVHLLDYAIRQGGAQAAVQALPLMEIIGAAMQAHTAEQAAAAQAAEATPAEAPAPAAKPTAKPARRK